MASTTDIVSRMIDALAVSDPELDTSIGSTTRKILDAVGEQVAQASMNSHLLDYQFDVDTKYGADLDDFCLMFGISRLAAQRAVGLVTFSRPSPATADILIPASTLVVTSTSPAVSYTTTAPAYLTTGTSTVEVPIQAVLGGESGNTPAHTVTLLATPLDGISAATNNFAPITGGANAEPDSALVDRFKKTVFRSLAGTEDMYLGVAVEASLDVSDVESPTQAIVLGGSRVWREQVQVAVGGTATSVIPAGNVNYIFPGTSVVGSNIDAGAILTEGVNYTFDGTATPPLLTIIGASAAVGDLLDLEFEYSSTASRNDPLNAISNRVDVWTNGVRPVVASEMTFFQNTSVFITGATGQMAVQRWVRLNTPGTNPTVGNVFLRLAWGPILTFPAALTVAGTTYHLGTDYWVVHDDTAFGYGPTSLFGLEWKASSAPVAASAINLTGGSSYTYNQVPRDVEDRIRRWRLVATDARAHAAKQVNLRLSFAVMFDKTYSASQVKTDVQTALTHFFTASGFDAQIQASDIIDVAHNVQGVDNIRFLTSAEPVNVDQYAVEQVDSSGNRIAYITTGGRARDLYLGDNQIPVLYSVNFVTKAANTFGVL